MGSFKKSVNLKRSVRFFVYHFYICPKTAGNRAQNCPKDQIVMSNPFRVAFPTCRNRKSIGKCAESADVVGMRAPEKSNILSSGPVAQTKNARGRTRKTAQTAAT